MRSSFAPPTRTRRASASRLAWLVLGAVASLAAPAAANGPDTPADEVLASLQKRYDGVRDLRARFVQHSFVAALDETSSTRGEVRMRRPDRMRWAYDAPDGRIIALMGDTLRLYDPLEGQLQILPVAEGGVSPTALGFLMGGARLADEFRAELVGDPRPEVGLRLVPRTDPGFESLVVWLDPATYELRASELTDLIGNRTRIELSDAVYDAGLSDAEFDIEIAEGTEEIDLR